MIEKDKFFIYGRVGIGEWNWKQEGKLIASVLRKSPQSGVAQRLKEKISVKAKEG